MDTRPDHAASMREIARGVARDLQRIAAGTYEAEPMGLTSFFRVHSHWRSHGWYGDLSMDRLKEICGRVFARDSEDPRAFVRGLRSTARIVAKGNADAAGTIDDRDVFWRCVAGLERETGVPMPARLAERTGPVLRGH